MTVARKWREIEAISSRLLSGGLGKYFVSFQAVDKHLIAGINLLKLSVAKSHSAHSELHWKHTKIIEQTTEAKTL